MTLVEHETETAVTPWEGPLGLVGYATSDRRYLIPGEIDMRALPLPLNVQLSTGEGHDGSVNAGRIESIEQIPVEEIDDERRAQFGLDDLPDGTIVVWGIGVFDGSPAAIEAQRMIANGAGISLDLPPERYGIFNADTMEEVPEDEVDLEEVMAGNFLTGIGGKIAGATVVTVPAFEHARLSIEVTGDEMAVVSSASIQIRPTSYSNGAPPRDPRLSAVEAAEAMKMIASATDLAYTKVFVASGGLAIPLRPPREWLDDPGFLEPTPLTYTDEGRVFGHLALWDSCHTGYTGVCVAPPASPTNYSYFNTGLLDTDNGQVPCGKLMFSTNGGKHAPLEMAAQEASRHYDDSSKVGAYVRAGADIHGIWLAGVLKPGLSEADLQHLRLHPPSGDWRGIAGSSELVAAFSVPVGGFPIPQAEARLVASGELDEIAALILAPAVIEEPSEGFRARMRKKKMLRDRVTYSDGFRDVSTKERRRLAKTGAAMPDGSFPIANCSDAANARRAIGRTSPAKRAAVQRHIARREKSLGCSDE